MPYFSAFKVQNTAKGQVVSDGETFTTDSSTGHTVPVIPSTFTAFKGVPVRSTTGVWSVTMKDPAFKVIDIHILPLTTTANAVSVVVQPLTLDSAGRAVINWTFCTFGTTTPADLAASQQFQVFFMYSELSVS